VTVVHFSAFTAAAAAAAVFTAAVPYVTGYCHCARAADTVTSYLRITPN